MADEISGRNSSDFAALCALTVNRLQEAAVFFIDTEGRITSWNPGVGRLLGYAEHEWVGQSVAIIFTPEERSRGEDRKELATAASDGEAMDVRWHLRKDGTSIFVDGLIHAVRDEQRVLHDLDRHSAFVQPGGQQSVRTADYAASARSRTVDFQKPANIVALIHRSFSLVVRAARDR